MIYWKSIDILTFWEKIAVVLVARSYQNTLDVPDKLLNDHVALEALVPRQNKVVLCLNVWKLLLFKKFKI